MDIEIQVYLGLVNLHCKTGNFTSGGFLRGFVYSSNVSKGLILKLNTEQQF
jgi:hypothetical protein